MVPSGRAHKVGDKGGQRCCILSLLLCCLSTITALSQPSDSSDGSNVSAAAAAQQGTCAVYCPRHRQLLDGCCSQCTHRMRALTCNYLHNIHRWLPALRAHSRPNPAPAKSHQPKTSIQQNPEVKKAAHLSTCRSRTTAHPSMQTNRPKTNRPQYQIPREAVKMQTIRPRQSAQQSTWAHTYSNFVVCH